MRQVHCLLPIGNVINVMLKTEKKVNQLKIVFIYGTIINLQ